MSTGETTVIRIDSRDAAHLKRIADHIPKWKGKPHTTADMISMMMDFIYSCYPDLDVSHVDNDSNMKNRMDFRMRLYWQAYVERSWGKYIK